MKDDIKGQNIKYYSKSQDTSGYTEFDIKAIFRDKKLLAQQDNNSVLQIKNTYIQVLGSQVPVVPKKGDYVICNEIIFDICTSDINNKVFNSTLATINEYGIISIYLIQRTKTTH